MKNKKIIIVIAIVILFFLLLLIKVPNKNITVTTSKKQNLNITVKSQKEETIKLKVTNSSNKDTYDIVMNNKELSTSSNIVYILEDNNKIISKGLIFPKQKNTRR